MSEIKITTTSLDEVISRIEASNAKINEILNDAKGKIETLDVETWSSPGKRELDESVNPFIAQFENIYKDLQEYTKYLHMVSKVHQEEGSLLSQAVEESTSGLGGTL